MTSRTSQNRPFKFGAKDRKEFIVEDSEVAIRAQNDGNGNAIYVGRAKVGVQESENKWQISFHTYDGNNAFTSRTWPENDDAIASSDYEFVWTNRAGYTYS